MVQVPLRAARLRQSVLQIAQLALCSLAGTLHLLPALVQCGNGLGRAVGLQALQIGCGSIQRLPGLLDLQLGLLGLHPRLCGLFLPALQAVQVLVALLQIRERALQLCGLGL